MHMVEAGSIGAGKQHPKLREHGTKNDTSAELVLLVKKNRVKRLGPVISRCSPSGVEVSEKDHFIVKKGNPFSQIPLVLTPHAKLEQAIEESRH